VDYAPDELVVVCLMRDALPYVRSFVEHYFSLGAKHLVFLDNGSRDGTVEVLRAHENVTILHTDVSFKEYQKYLKRYLIHRFGKRDRWVLYVDQDELFDYPYSDVVSLGSFLHYLTENSYTAVVAQMLDMFPEEPVSRAANVEDEPLKERHRFYDVSDIAAQDYHAFQRSRNVVANQEIEVHKGGILKTVFGRHAFLTKHPLVFLDEEIESMYPGAHWVGGARVADISCPLFHYKFIGDVHERTMRAVEEDSYANDSAKYRKFLKTLEQNPELSVKRETARELRHVNDLVENQFLVVSGDYLIWVDAEEKNGGPRRLAEAFSKASARARTQASEADNFQRQAERLDGSLGEEHRRVELLEKENRSLKKRNRSLESQMRKIQGSRIWRLLDKFGRIRARIQARKG